MKRFFLDQDNDSHWYIVPVARSAEWNAWTDLDPDTDEAAWTPPTFVIDLGCHPNMVTFSQPKVGE